MWSSWNSQLLVEMQSGTVTQKWCDSFLQRKTMHLPYLSGHPVPLVVGIYRSEMKICPPINLYLHIHNSPILEAVQMPIKMRMGKFCLCVHYSLIRKELLMHATSCIHQESIFLSERCKNLHFHLNFRKGKTV